MAKIQDAPYIREAETRGTDYMSEYYGFAEEDDEACFEPWGVYDPD